MQFLKDIFTLIRLPNVFFIFLSQVLVYYKIIDPNLNKAPIIYDILLFALSTAFISIGGYIINDYFDVKIDEINKPLKVTVEKKFRRRRILVAHIVISCIGLYIAYGFAKYANMKFLISIQIMCILLLIAYSSHFKRKLIIGNITIAFLAYISVITPAIYERFFDVNFLSSFPQKLLLYYAVFAFLFTWMREIAKDIEDIKGDKKLGCKTIPIVFGIRTARKFIYSIAILTILSCIYSIIKIKSNYILGVNIFTILCCMYIIFLCSKSYTQLHFKKLSLVIKTVTFIGIISIIGI